MPGTKEVWCNHINTRTCINGSPDDTILSVLRAHGISALDWVIFDNGRINRTHRVSPYLLFFQECLAFQEGDRSDSVLKQLKEYVQGLWCKLAVPSCKRMILSFPFLGYFEVAVPEAATDVKVYEAFHKAVRTDSEFWKYQTATQLCVYGPVTASPLRGQRQKHTRYGSAANIPDSVACAA